MELGPADRRRLVDDGYVLLPGVVPRPRVEAALRAINASLGERGMAPERLGEMRARTFCPEVVEAPEIVGLFGATPLAALAESAIGAGRLRAPTRGQIALRFPLPAQAPPAADPPPHVDGMYTPDNGVPAGTLYHFTALAAVFLSDVTAAEAGNFTVWPGSHTVLSGHLRRHGVESLLAGFPALPLGDPRPIQASAGDALLAHYLLAHGVSANRGPAVRYAVFFRLFHVDHDQVGTRALLDPWAEWEGLRGDGFVDGTPLR